MPESVNEISHPERFVGSRVVHTRTPDNHELFFLSGIFLTNLKGETDAQWRWDTISLAPKIPTPTGQMIKIHQAAPAASLNSVLNLGHSINSGFAVDSCVISVTKVYGGIIPIELHLAVRDSDAYLYRIGYTATVLGEYAASDLQV